MGPFLKSIKKSTKIVIASILQIVYVKCVYFCRLVSYTMFRPNRFLGNYAVQLVPRVGATLGVCVRYAQRAGHVYHFLNSGSHGQRHAAREGREEAVRVR